MPQNIISINPANGKEAGTYGVADEDKIQRVLTTAVDGFNAWRKVALSERGDTLKKIANEIRNQKEHLALLATTEMGKPIQQSRDEVEKCAVTLEFYAKEGRKFLADELITTDAVKSYVAFKPLGVILAIMPWNFPYWQVFRAMGPALMAGNTMILKHASNVSGCALAIEKIVMDAGAPTGLFQTLILPSSSIGSLIDNTAIAAITLTGSAEAGSKVAAAAGKNLKKAVLELGGSDAYVVLEDANLDKAVAICVKGRLVNSGQSCVAAKRFIVLPKNAKAFEQAMTEQMMTVKYGDPMDTASKIGPMSRADLRDQLHAQVQKSVELGAQLLCGGFIPDSPGAFYPPTVLTHVKKGMPAYDEELFGPVAAIIEATDEVDAIRIANDNVYGLGGCILSENRDHAEELAANEMQAGMCFVNESVHSDARLPFGGIKHSGYGRELGSFGIREFVNIKTVFIK